MTVCLLSCKKDPASSSELTKKKPNSAPTAFFTISPLYGDVSTTFQFDASESSDSAYSFAQLRFNWDWENDGT
jgi:PKD repeat protein